MNITDKQKNISQHFLKLIQTKRLGHSYIFTGQDGTGKRDMAKWISQALFCEDPAADGSPCGECFQCLKILQDQHLDVIEKAPTNAQGLTEKQVKGRIQESDQPEKEADKYGRSYSLKVDEMRELKAELSLSGVESRKKVIIIDQAQTMTISSANSLLKLIEEPQADLLMIFITENKDSLLPTIISRSQIIHFTKVDSFKKIEEFKDSSLSDWQAPLLARLTQSLDKALEVEASLDLDKISRGILKWFDYVVKGDWQAFIYVQVELKKLVESNRDQEFFLDLLVVFGEDLLKVKYHQESPLAYQGFADPIKNYSEYLSTHKIVLFLESSLLAKRKFQANVGFQACLEDLTLQVIG